MSDTVKSWIEERQKAQGRSSGEQWWEGSGFINDPDDDRRTLHAVMVNESDYAIAGICYVNRADAEAIVDAHNMLPRALDALEQVLELIEFMETDAENWLNAGHLHASEVLLENAGDLRQAIEGAINE